MNKPERMDTATEDAMLELGRRARAAAHLLSLASPEAKNNALIAAAEALRAATPEILAANVKDIEAARAAGRPESFIDRLLLNEKRINAMADGIAEIAKLADPIGTVLAEWQRPNGLRFQRVRVPLGVIGIIYESRPNVTADAGALALKAGNAAILRGGSESIHSSRVIHAALVAGLKTAGLPEAAISLVPTPDRAAVGMMLTGLNGTVDVIVPRGGKSLVERVQNEARVPVFAHLEGLCHTYVDRNADLAMAVDIVLNAKMRRTGVCGATETLLVDSGAPAAFMPTLVKALLDAGCEVRGDTATQQADARVKPAADADWSTEYLDAIISAREVDGIDGALAHIARYSTQHTDAIVTNDADTAARFQREVDSAIVVHNASTQFADGGEFGFGGEIGIATGKMHARGPVGVEQLTSFKYVVMGNGQTRPS
ncbi:glutamate-5-semialdehyde dehydrogenase [Hyphomicrobium sulfonivorans]|uniref:glutamate-5-semialdehyde dehydrogenase n=1 Tax=Hyphomicrobium sulfonivorans TaxID=121290 RepID=UPI00156E8F6C|nr:glutamate-5-semialdehyde dehydrogenase [Hyphomicrobium sulfonivorans]MBI1648805.1 glutamate-5-semialdehyde dehydrogenase [Hyphomicrobium sulfonivorans]NSL70660.1 glutamate-5-semialdehyde dehydrogenase [Hyphomicrobium sulfonivorans]